MPKRKDPMDRAGPLTGAKSVYEFIKSKVQGKRRERFIAILLDSKNRVIRTHVVSIGSATASLVHPREVFGPALRANASSIILVHNHPSGDPSPSWEDRSITDRLRQAGELLGIVVLDHVIVGSPKGGFYSCAEHGEVRPGNGHEVVRSDERKV
jgi:DNA repair protein RadC